MYLRCYIECGNSKICYIGRIEKYLNATILEDRLRNQSDVLLSEATAAKLISMLKSSFELEKSNFLYVFHIQIRSLQEFDLTVLSTVQRFELQSQVLFSQCSPRNRCEVKTVQGLQINICYIPNCRRV